MTKKLCDLEKKEVTFFRRYGILDTRNCGRQISNVAEKKGLR